MATKLAEMYVEIKTKVSNFKKELDDAERATEKTGKKMEDRFNRVGREVNGVFTTLKGIAALGSAAAALGATAFGGISAIAGAADREGIARSQQALGNAGAALGLGQQIALSRAGRTLNPLELARLQGRFGAINATNAAGQAVRSQAISELGLGGLGFNKGTFDQVARFLRDQGGFNLIPNAIDAFTGADSSVADGAPGSLIGQFNARTNRQAIAGRSFRLGTEDLLQEQALTQFGGFVNPQALVDANTRLIEEIINLRNAFEAARNN